jgi:glutathione S-transferase
MKLYYAPGACSFASHIALEEIGLPYDTVKLNLAEGDQRKPEYLALNPRGRVPTLVVNGHVLTENVGIMTYLAGGYPEAKLWPKDTWHQAMAVSAMAWISNTVHPAYGHLLRPARYVDGDVHQEAVKAKGKENFGKHLEEIDTLLKGRKWAIGNHYTVVDGYLLVFYRWGNRAGLPVKSLANYTALVDRVLARPAVKKVMADEGITMS